MDTHVEYGPRPRHVAPVDGIAADAALRNDLRLGGVLYVGRLEGPDSRARVVVLTTWPTGLVSHTLAVAAASGALYAEPRSGSAYMVVTDHRGPVEAVRESLVQADMLTPEAARARVLPVTW